MGLGSCLQGPLEWRSLPDFSPFGFYLCSLAFLEKLADTCSIYWQIPKMRWGLYNLWGEPYLLGYELEDNNPYLRGLHLCRQGFFAGEASFDLAFLLGLLRLEEPYGAEVRPGFPRWKRLVPIIMQGHLFTLRRLLNKPKFYAPWARHLGYLPWALQEPLFPSPFGNRLVDLRLFPSPLLGVAFYFFVLLFLTGFAPSFRKLFFPKVIEGGAEQY